MEDQISFPLTMLTGGVVVLAASLSLNIWQFTRYDSSAAVSEKQLDHALSLPNGWWSDATRFETERRAIFSRVWLCVSHRSRFQKPGDYIVYEVAGFHFFMILGKDMVVRSFHNVCRHRAFPVARKQSGSATVLGCRYHGWSYDTKGALIKAPFFDDLPGFDRSQNSLFEIYTKQDGYGFLHINVSTDDGVAVSVPPKGRQVGKLAKIRLDSELLDTLEFKGKFNWKVILNNDGATSSTSISSTGAARVFSTQGPTPVGELDYYPLTTVHTMSGRPFWYQLTYSPDNAQQTSLRCDVYSNQPGKYKFEGSAKDALENEIKDRIQALELEHKKLITPGRNPIGNSKQAKVAAAVEAHLAQESTQGSMIKPAAVKQKLQSEAITKADQICQAMECGSGGTLSW